MTLTVYRDTGRTENDIEDIYEVREVALGGATRFLHVFLKDGRSRIIDDYLTWRVKENG